MTALVAIPSSVGFTRTCGVSPSPSPLNAGLASQRLLSPSDTFRISSPASSSMSQTRSGWHVTTASESPYGYWMNSSFRMIGAWPFAFHAFIPLALAEEKAVEPALLLCPAELPRRRGEPQKARHRRHHNVGFRDLERTVRAVVLVQVGPGRAAGVRVDLLQPLLHRDPVRHHLPCPSDECGELVADDALINRMPTVFGGLDGEGSAQGVHFDDVRDGLVLKAQPDEA